MTDLAHVHVVVPARNEAAHLPRMLESLSLAVEALRGSRPNMSVAVTVVLDLCTDSSAEVLGEHPWIDVVSVDLGLVGRVRAEGVERARRRTVPASPSRVWIASTDADTVVPPSWLVDQVEVAESGADFYTGVVTPDADDLPSSTRLAWWARHQHVDGHPHVHGANLGFTLAAYDCVGGYDDVATGEDERLVRDMRSAGLAGVATAANSVTTSGRLVGRAPGGFAAYLLALGNV